MAPILTALLPFALLPALLALLGHPAALPFAGFAGGTVLLVQAAQVAIGCGRLPLVCLGGIGAAGAALPLAGASLGLTPALALALTPLLGLALGGLVWLVVRRQGEIVMAALGLPLLLALVGLPALTATPGVAGVALPLGPELAAAVASIGLVLLLTRRFVDSPAARLHEAAVAAGLPAPCLGLDRQAFGATAWLLGAALAAAGGAVLTLGPDPLQQPSAADWAALAIALFAVGRLGGSRLGGALLAALPLLLLPKLAVVLAPTFIDLTLGAALAALALQLVIRADGSPAWVPPASAETVERLPHARLAER